MCLEQKNSSVSTVAWQPSATLTILKKRADILRRIRQFFFDRQVLEVETPVLSHTTGTDPYVLGIPVAFQKTVAAEVETLYLQTSPEYAMKRLLAAGSGPIFQISKAFRQGDIGKYHNPEFTMLEWYRPGFDHHDLMDEMDLLLQAILQTSTAEKISYGALFEKYVGVNPHTATVLALKTCAAEQHIQIAGDLSDRNAWLDLLLTHAIEPYIGRERPVFLYDFPVKQAALAKIRWHDNPPVASRFEVYFKGIELANGFHELQDVDEQRQRFISELRMRQHLNLPSVPLDEYFLAALQQGLPDCAGVALGVDRLVMLALGCHSIADVTSFSFDR